VALSANARLAEAAVRLVEITSGSQEWSSVLPTDIYNAPCAPLVGCDAAPIKLQYGILRNQ
jgi:hypothetical protein